MALLTHDTVRSRRAQGIALALVAACSFGMSGAIARGLLDAGWTAGAATFARVGVAAVVLAIPALFAMRGQWNLMRRSWGTVVAYGTFAVAGAQLFYFLAVGSLDVGVALLIEYLAPVAVIGWLWLTQGSRPGALTLAGAALALGGLVLLLDLLGGSVDINAGGVAWAMLAMVGASVYFIISADESHGLPPVALAWGGLVTALAVLGVAGLSGILPMHFATGSVRLVPVAVPWWVAVLVLGAVSGALAYVAGIAATRRLGARLGSFLGLVEVIAAAGFAWVLVGQQPAPIQFAGAALILGGVVLIRLGEPNEPALAHAPGPELDLSEREFAQDLEPALEPAERATPVAVPA